MSLSTVIDLALLASGLGVLWAVVTIIVAAIDSRRYARNLERAAQKERDAAVREAERILGGVA